MQWTPPRQTYPDTLEQAAARYTARCLAAADGLDAETNALDDNPEAQAYRRAAAATARAYGEQWARRIDAGEPVTLDDVAAVELVARAAEMSGWLSAGPIDDNVERVDVARQLVDAGVFVRQAKVPGKFVACYRLGTVEA